MHFLQTSAGKISCKWTLSDATSMSIFFFPKISQVDSILKKGFPSNYFCDFFNLLVWNLLNTTSACTRILNIQDARQNIQDGCQNIQDGCHTGLPHMYINIFRLPQMICSHSIFKCQTFEGCP